MVEESQWILVKAYGRPGPVVPSLTGTAAERAEEIRAYAREDISHVQIYPGPCTVAGIEAFAPVLAILNREIGTDVCRTARFANAAPMLG